MVLVLSLGFVLEVAVGDLYDVLVVVGSVVVDELGGGGFLAGGGGFLAGGGGFLAGEGGVLTDGGGGLGTGGVFLATGEGGFFDSLDFELGLLDDLVVLLVLVS